MNNEPVAWLIQAKTWHEFSFNKPAYDYSENESIEVEPLYTHPAELTDEEIIEVRQTTRTNDTSNWADTLAFARAILRKAQEK